MKIIYGDNAGENDGDSLTLFLTRLGIRHLSLMAECQFQNGLAENGGWLQGCGVRHDMDLRVSGPGPIFEEFNISFNAQQRNILSHESLGGCVLFSIFFPPSLLHCNCSSLLVVTPPFSSQRQPSSKRRKRGVSLASILEPLSLAANLAISCGYHLKTVSPQQCTPLSTKIFPARLFSPRIPDLFVSSPSPHNKLLDDDLSVSHYTLLLLLLRKKWSSSFAGSSMCLNIFFRFVSLFF